MNQYLIETPDGDHNITIAGGKFGKIITVYNDSGECLYSQDEAPETPDANCVENAIDFVKDFIKSQHQEQREKRQALLDALNELNKQETDFRNRWEGLPSYLEAIHDEIDDLPCDERTWDYTITS
jgi:hypothetical protein